MRRIAPMERGAGGWMFRVRFMASAAHAAGSAGPKAADAGSRPLIANIIDDLGYLRDEGILALEFPGEVTYSFLPRTPYARRLARLAKPDAETIGVTRRVRAPSSRISGSRAVPPARGAQSSSVGQAISTR